MVPVGSVTAGKSSSWLPFVNSSDEPMKEANTSSGDGGNITATIAGTGDINVHHNITADRDVNLNTNSGNILFEGVQDGHEDLYVTSNHGDVTVSINEGGSGVIKDTNSEGAAGDWAHLIAAEGNVTVKHDGVGDVDLYELYAKQDAGVSVADGNLHLVNVSGNLVAVFVKSTGKEMDVENIEAAQSIAISGSNMDLDSIKQREDGDGFLWVQTDNGYARYNPATETFSRDVGTWLHKAGMEGGASSIYIHLIPRRSSGCVCLAAGSCGVMYRAGAGQCLWPSTLKGRGRWSLSPSMAIVC